MPASLAQIAAWLGAEVLADPEDLERQTSLVHACDLMSDVLAFSRPDAVLLTGLVNQQVIRTAEVAGIIGVVFVRGKRPGQEVVEMAREAGLPLLATQHSMFHSCAILSREGLEGCVNHVQDRHQP